MSLKTELSIFCLHLSALPKGTFSVWMRNIVAATLCFHEYEVRL